MDEFDNLEVKGDASGVGEGESYVGDSTIRNFDGIGKISESKFNDSAVTPLKPLLIEDNTVKDISKSKKKRKKRVKKGTVIQQSSEFAPTQMPYTSK